ncbi:ABC transporter permease [Clostridium sp. SHJSY1]|uniref:ABC transporter permease n=1 Tax=Clostridium sp. SHJSY1 TaxID=2942483 RepID=UPI00287416A4|nr:ABC transporter permease [Clostridium sp. SHJSY1]MDS0525518.1 ABC transporter permease [Clostridium sp. SHJSY1]
MLNLLKNEFYKLKKSKMFYFCLFCIIMQAVVVYCIPDKTLLKSGKEMLRYITNVQNGLGTNMVIGVFAAECIVTEFTSGYIKNLIAYGHKRITIFMSKVIVYYTSSIIMGLALPIGMMIINTAINGYGEIFDLKAFVHLIGMILIVVVIQVGICSLNVFVAFISRSVNITVIAAIVFDFINRLINIMVVQKSSCEWAINHYVYSQPTIVFSYNVRTRDFIQAIIVSLVTITITTVVSIYSFNKADIK